jgi:hypothetical protein
MAILEDLIRAIELWLQIAKEQVSLVDPILDPMLLVPRIAGCWGWRTEWHRERCKQLPINSPTHGMPVRVYL